MSGLEICVLLLGAGAVALPVFLSQFATRWLAAFWLGLVFVGLARAAGLGAVGAFASCGVALLLAWSGPLMVVRRAAFLFPSLVLVVYATTLLMYKAPGNPFAQERVASPEVEAALRAHYGVPEDASEFFAIYLKRLVIDGSLGPSIKVQGRSVEALLGPALPVSLSLGAVALLIALTLGLALGVRAGLRPGSLDDQLSMALALIGISLPNFVIGALLMGFFALRLGWLPVAGWGSYAHLVLPAFTLALPYAATIARLARSGTIEVMSQDFVRTARAKGIPEREVVWRHAIRGALLPVVSYLGPAAAGIMTGSFVIEVLFGVPGMGQWFVKGAINRDYAVVLGTAIIYFGLITLFNLAVDLAYAWLDPRTREQA